MGAYASRYCGGEGFDIDGAQRQAVIGFCAGRSGRALDHVQAVHGGLLAAHATAGREIPGVPDVGRTGTQEIRIERKNYICLIELIVRVERLAESLPRRSARCMAARRFITVPLGFRELLQHGVELVGQRG